MSRGIYTSPKHTAVTVGTGTTLALAANTGCQTRVFVNDSDEAIYLSFNASAVLNAGIRLNANGGSYEMAEKFGNLYQGVVNAISTSGSKKLLVTEGS
jgi:hypothetical protein